MIEMNDIAKPRRRSRPDRRSARKPIECPQSAPLLMILCGTRGRHVLRYADSWSCDSSRKPFGARCLELYLGIGDDLLPVSQCTLAGEFTRNPIEIEFEDADDKKCATYYARWAGARSETGPWSLPVTFTIAA